MITVAHEALIDLIPVDVRDHYQAVPGGSPANVAVGLARLGVPVARIGRTVEGAGVRLRDAAGRPIEPARAGWRHF